MSWFGNIFKGFKGSAEKFYRETGRVARVAVAKFLGGNAHSQGYSDPEEQARCFKGWVYVAVHRTAVAGMSCETTITSEGDDKPGEVSAKKWYSRVIHTPNSYMSRELMTYYRLQQLSLTGQSLVWNMPNKDGTKIIGRYIIPTGAATFMPWGGGVYKLNTTWANAYLDDSDAALMEGSPIMSVFLALQQEIPASQVTRVVYPHPLSTVLPYSPLEACAPWIDVEKGNNERWAAHLRNGHSPTLIVQGNFASLPQDELDAMAIKFSTKYGGVDNASKAVFLDGEDMKVSPLNIPMRDQEYANTSSTMRSNVMAVFGVPEVAAGITEAGSYAGFMASLRQFTTITLQPMLDLLAASDTHVLRSFANGDDHVLDTIKVEYKCKTINDEELGLRKATEIRSGKYAKVNEWREAVGLPPDEKIGDKYIYELDQETQQSAMGGGAQPAPVDGEQPDQSGTEVDDEQIGGFDNGDDQRFTEDPVAKAYEIDPKAKRFHELCMTNLGKY